MQFINNHGNNTTYPLTHPQKRIWYTEKIHSGISINNIGGTVRIYGPIDFKLLERAINTFIKVTEGIRLQVLEIDGNAAQYVKEYENEKIDFFDFSQLKDSQNLFETWVSKEARTPFNFENSKLYYFAMFKISENYCGYLLKFHHIISDGWSINIVTKQIFDYYERLLNGNGISEIKGESYLEYLKTERAYLQSERFLKNKKFWNDKFDTLLGLNNERKSENNIGKRKSFVLDLETTKQVYSFIEEVKCSLNTFFAAILVLYISKLTNNNDIVIGTPILNRSGKKEKNIFGMFTSTMPFRYLVDQNQTFIEHIKGINSELMSFLFNQKYPYELLVKDIELKKKDFGRLFDISLNYYNSKLNYKFLGMDVDNVEFYNGYQENSLQIIVKDWTESGKIQFDFDYKSCYTDIDIENLYCRIADLTSKLSQNWNCSLLEADIVPYKERVRLFNDFNETIAQYPKEKSIQILFEEQVKRTPKSHALIIDDKILTYNELNKKANQLADFLSQEGTKKGDIVGLMITHSFEVIISILAILKCGAAFLPIEPESPDERVKFILKDSGVKLLLVNYELPLSFGFDGRIVNINTIVLEGYSEGNPKITGTSSDLAYVIYTSGSTGNPKGVLVGQRNLVNYIWWAKKNYIKSSDDVFGFYSSIAFDLTITSMFTPLVCGCKVAIYRDDRDEYVLYRILKDNLVTILKLTPSHLSLIKELDLKDFSIRRFIVGGENLKTELARKINEIFNGTVEIYNEYGPTETTVGCMIYLYSDEDDNEISVPIGHPADNVQIYILDSNQKPVPEGRTGEIYISGDGVTFGYLNRDELTNERFLSNPFILGKKTYKSGDLGRFIKRGVITYEGRADEQIKIRGFRIEVGEIEARIMHNCDIKSAAVVVREDDKRDKFLCAYYESIHEIQEGKLRQNLRNFLPEYMIPKYFIKVDRIPLTRNGKVDKNALLEFNSNERNDEATLKPSSKKDKIIVEIIEEVLDIDRIKSGENFYQLGGDSIKAIQISSKLRSKGIILKVKDILSKYRIEDIFSFALEVKEKETSENLISGNIENTPIISWFFLQSFKEPSFYNQSVLLKINGDISVEVFEDAFKKLIILHDALRINYNPKIKQLYYNSKHLDTEYKINVFNLSELNDEQQSKSFAEISQKEKSSLNIENSLLIKSCLFDMGSKGTYLMITAHHLVVDGVSWRILLTDMYEIIQDILNNNNQSYFEKQIKNRRSSFKDWASCLHANKEKLVAPYKDFHHGYTNYNTKNDVCENIASFEMGNVITESFEINHEEIKLLQKDANRPFNTNSRDLLITSLLLTVQEYFSLDKIAIEIEGHGREDIFEGVDILRTVGWFTNLYPVSFSVQNINISEIIKDVKETIRKFSDNGLGLGVLKYLMNLNSAKQTPLIRFNYLGDFGVEFHNSIFLLLTESSGLDYSEKNHLTSKLDMNLILINGNLKVNLIFDGIFFEEPVAKKFCSSYAKNIKRVILFCANKENIEFTPSDFDAINITQEELNILFE